MCSDKHRLSVVPVKLLASHRQAATHAFEDAVLESFLEGLDSHLVVGLELFDCGYDARTISGGDRGGLDDFVHVELDVSCLEVMVVDFDAATNRGVLGVNEPLRLPFATPEGWEVQVNARDVNLQLACLVEAETSSGRSFLEDSIDVAINCLCHSRPEHMMRITR